MKMPSPAEKGDHKVVDEESNDLCDVILRRNSNLDLSHHFRGFKCAKSKESGGGKSSTAFFSQENSNV